MPATLKRLRPDPRRIRIGKPDPNLTSVAGLVMFGVFLRTLGVDRALRDAFGGMKTGPNVIYPMAAQLRMLLDLFVLGEHRVFSLEALSADQLFTYLACGVISGLDTVYRDLKRFDDTSVAELEQMMASHGLANVSAKKRELVHLDIDTTVESVFGEIEGAVPGPNSRGPLRRHHMRAQVADRRRGRRWTRVAAGRDGLLCPRRLEGARIARPGHRRPDA